MKFGDKLVGLRKKNGLSQEELAEKLGVSRQSVSKWESNNAYPETDKIVQICNLFDCSMDDLINDQITDLKEIERKEKNNLAKSMDSFLDFITKTINMFSDMTFGSGLKCVLKMGLLALLLFFLGLFVVGVTSSLIGNLFSFLKHADLIELIIHNVLNVVWFILSLIVLIHTFKIKYLNYYVKVKEEKEESSENKDEKIQLKKEEKIEVTGNDDKSYSFLNTLSKVIKICVKIVVGFFSLFIIPWIVGLGIVLILSLLHITVSSLFVGIFISTLSALTICIVIMAMIINFIFNRKSKYKVLLISFLSSLVLFGVGIGICTSSIKNFKIEDAKTFVNDTKVIDYDYSDKLVIQTRGLDDIEYNFDESLGNKIKVEVKFNNKFNDVKTLNENYYGSNVLIIDRITKDFNAKDMYDIIIKDIKNNTLREYDNSFIVTVTTSKATADKLIDNTSKTYSFDKKEIKNGYKLNNITHLIREYNNCENDVEYDAYTKELKTPNNCKCEKIESGNNTEINCE